MALLIVQGCLGSMRRTGSMRYAPFGLRCGKTAPETQQASAGATSQMMAERRGAWADYDVYGGYGTVRLPMASRRTNRR